MAITMEQHCFSDKVVGIKRPNSRTLSSLYQKSKLEMRKSTPESSYGSASVIPLSLSFLLRP